MASVETIPADQAPPAPPNGQALATKPVRERIQVHFNPDDPASFYMDTGIFEQMQRVALLMARSHLVPGHLQGEERVSDCFLVTAQAFRWRMDPFSVAQHTFVLKGKLGYEGKLIAGIINASGKLKENLGFEYSGTGKERKVTVSGQLKSEQKVRTVEGTVEAWSTDNDMWKDDPDQILAYRGARQWARRHMPEAVLGIMAEEELSAASQTVHMTRGSDGAFETTRANPPAKDPLLEAIGITATVQEPEKVAAPEQPVETKAATVDLGCLHPDVPQSKVAALAKGRSITCTACGEDLRNE